MYPYLAQSANPPENTCERGKEHTNQPVVMICLEKDCGHRRKCCLTCVDELHRKHQLVSIHKFKAYVSEILSHNSMASNTQQILEAIELAQNSFQDKLNKIRDNFMKKLEEVEINMKEYLGIIKDSFGHQNYDNKIKELNQQFTDAKVDEIYKITKQTQLNLVQSSEEIQNSMKTTLNFLQTKSDYISNQIGKNFQQIDQAITNFKITGQLKNNKLIFNQQTKAACLIIGPDKKTVTRGEGTGGYPIVLVNQPFTQLNNQVKFRITTQPEKKAMWLGVCVRDIVKNFNYQSCYGLNKGTWAIDQVGVNHVSAYSWSHHDTNFNSTPKVGWQFHLGDVVSIKVDFQKSIARFTRNNDVYEQPIKLDLGEIFAFAGPTNVGDTYEIV